VATAEDLLRAEYSSRRYTTQDGLPSLLTQCLYQDERGFIWVASTSGLACFDGFGFKTYLKGKFANLYHLDENEAGEVRTFSNKYMYIFDNQADTLRKTKLSDTYFLTVHSSHGLPPGYGIFYTKNETEQALFAIRDTGLVKIMEHEDLNQLDDEDARAHYDVKRNLLYLTLKEGISVISGEKGRVAFHKGILARFFIQYQGNLWVIAMDGLYRFLENGQLELVIRHEIEESSGNVVAHVNADGSLLFTDYSTLYRYENNRIEKIFTANAIKDFLVDKEGNIWVATYQGLYNLFSLQFKNYVFTDKTDVARNLIYNPYDKKIIAATLNGRVIEIADESIRSLSYSPNPFTTDVCFEPYGLAFDKAIYLPGPGGLLQQKNGQSHWITFPEILKLFRFVVSLPDGNLLTGENACVIITTPAGNVLKKFELDRLKQRIYSKPCLDKQGRIWLGGASGVTIIDGDSINTVFGDNLAYSRVMNSDNEGNIWFASENRLFKCMGDSMENVKSFGSQITTIHFTKTDILMITTLDEIFLFDKTLQSSVLYNSQNGYTGMETVRVGVAEDEKGNVWLSSAENFTTFNPSKLMREQAKPQLHLLSVSFSRDNVFWQREKGNLLQFDYKQKNIRFNYIGLTYSSSQNVRYFYRLKGFQDEWSEPAKMREVTFNNLPPGDYVFEIYADAGNDSTQSEVQSVAFAIQPAFWQTAWFLVVVILALMLASAGIALFIQRRKNGVLLEHLETEKQLNELRIKSIRLKAIPHFNANVLAAIEYYIMNLSKTEALRLLGIYSRFTFQTLCEVDKASRSLSEELEYVKMYLELEKLRFIDKFDYRIDIDPTVDANVQLPNMILHTYCENAVKHGLSSKKAGGSLQIKVVQSDNIVCVSVEDNGVGREAAARNKNVPSSKQGLDILSRQIEIYNRFNQSKITQKVDDLYADGQPVGTRFTVEIPGSFVYQ
jgi:hypothetical protein